MKPVNDIRKKSLISIRRFDPTSSSEPVFKQYVIPYEEGSTVMDALFYIYRNIDGTLAFRTSCQCGLCFICLIQIDGKVSCPCKTYMKERMILEPLPNKKIIRDLVVDLDKVPGR